MIFGHFLTEVNEANVFICACEETRQALIVDMADWEPRMAAFIAQHQLIPKAIVITHDHFDHTAGLPDAVKACPEAVVYSGKTAIEGIPTVQLNHGNTLQIGTPTVEARHTPGHTPEGISLVLPDCVFTGDALFAGSVGGTGSQKYYDQQIAALKEHILTLPVNYEVHVGHGPSSTVGVEREFNPFFVE